ncbi:MAG: helix-turn-helix domain-containing protein [Cyclobacteriaceae bacterium]
MEHVHTASSLTSENFNLYVNSGGKLRNNKSNSAEVSRILVISTDRIFFQKVRIRYDGNFEVLQVLSPEDAVCHITSNPPDVVIYDEVRQESNGLMLTQALRSDHNTKYTVIIYALKENSALSEWNLLQTGVDEIFNRKGDLNILDIRMQRQLQYKKMAKNNMQPSLRPSIEKSKAIDHDESFLKNLIELVEDHIGNSEFNVDTIVKELGVSRSKLYLKLKELTDMSCTEFVRHIRIKKATKYMKQGSYSIKEIRNMLGFKSDSYFTKCFKKEYGEVPYKFLQRHKKARKFTIV